MLKLKIVKAFFYAEAMVTSPSCNLFSWSDRSIPCMVSTNWQSGVQSLILWLEFMTSVTRRYIFQNYHETTLILWLTSSLNCCTIVDVSCLPEEDLHCVDIAIFCLRRYSASYTFCYSNV